MIVVWIIIIIMTALAASSILSRRGRLVLITRPDELSEQKGLMDYFRRFSECDRAARPGCSDATQYLSLLVREPADRSVLEIAVENARSAIRSASRSGLSESLGIRDADAVLKTLNDPSLPWKIAVLDDLAENGWPHTHGEIICIPRSFRALPNLVQTLVHERVHVAQRRHPIVFRDGIAVGEWGMKPRPVDELDPRLSKFVRSNPDLDGFFYENREGVTTVSLFPSVESAKQGLRAAVARTFKDGEEIDGSGNTHEEHPYETQAYVIAESIVSA